MDQNSPNPYTEAEKAAKLGGDATAATGDAAAPRPGVAETIQERQVGTAEELMLPARSKILATVGRVVLVFNPGVWEGPRPAFVTSVSADEQGALVGASVHLDWQLDGEAMLANQRTVLVHGPLPLYDALRDEQRAQMRGPWAEWMPYQVGQAQRTQQAEGDLGRRVAQLEAAIAGLQLSGGRSPLVAAVPIEVVDLLTNHVRTMQHIEDTLGEVLRRVLAAAVNVVGEEATRELLAKLDAAAAHARAVQSQLRANPTPRLSGVPGYTGGVDIAADGGVSVAAPPAGGLAGGTPNP